MTKQQQLDSIADDIKNCTLCQRDSIGVAVAGEGNPNAEIVFIGEAPGKTEAVTGRPFVGRSGQLLRKMIREIGLDDQKDVYITSPVKYLPKRGTPDSNQIAHGREHLRKQLLVIEPKFVVLLGRVAAEGVLEKKVFVTKERGNVIDEKNGVKYFLTYHPAAVLRFPSKFKAAMVNDFHTVKHLVETSQ